MRLSEAASPWASKTVITGRIHITAQLGAPWIPTEFIEAFTAEVIGVTSRVMHCAEVACWTINKHAFAG